MLTCVLFGLQWAQDPDAFGCNAVPNPPLMRSASEFSLAGGLGDDGESARTSDSDTDDTASQCAGPRLTSRQRSQKSLASPPRRLRSMVAAGIAVGFAYAVGRSTNPRVKAAKRSREFGPALLS